MRMMFGATAAVLAAFGAEASAAELVFDDAVVRVVVIPETRSDIQIEVAQGGEGAPPVRVTRSGDRVIVSSGVEIRMCNFSDEGSAWVKLTRGGPRVDLADAASITVRAPRDVRISGEGGAVMGSIGRSQTLTIRQSGCVQWTAADVAGNIDAKLSTGATLRGGSTPIARLTADSGGSVRLVRVDRLEATATAGGSIKAGAVPGEVEAVAHGGLIDVGGGSTRRFTGDASGGAQIRHRGQVGELSADASGGAVIRVDRAARVLSSSEGYGSSVRINGGSD